MTTRKQQAQNDEAILNALSTTLKLRLLKAGWLWNIAGGRISLRRGLDTSSTVYIDTLPATAESAWAYLATTVGV